VAEVEILGEDRLIARLAQFEESLDFGAEAGVKSVAEKIRDRAKELVQVDTGALQRSIRVGIYSRPAGHVHSIRVTAGGYERNPKTGRIVDYAVYQERGTSRMKAQPYLGPAYQAFKDDLAKEIKEAKVKH
jgi:HK97 gp10 family phage protein